jgi:hypothetical protein
VADLTGPDGGGPDGLPDLVVTSGQGDVLVLAGKGDGMFQQPVDRQPHIALAVADLTGDGHDDYVFADEGLDRVTVVYGGTGSAAALPVPQKPLLAPSAVRLADLNGDGIPDLVVADGGGNDVLVYPGLGGGQFGPARVFSAGTDPVSLMVADLNGDRLPDLVVTNEGSNDVSVLLGQGRGTDWTLLAGPRVQAGQGPVSTAVEDLNGNGVPDLLVSDAASGNLTRINGVGGGFFDDQHPVVTHLPTTPGALIPLPDDPRGVAVLEPEANAVLFIRNVETPSVQFAVSSGGVGPVAAVADDFNHDGVDDLLVANHGDGSIALLLGAEQERSVLVGTVAQAADLALSGLGDAVYVTSDRDNDSVTRLAIPDLLLGQLGLLGNSPDLAGASASLPRPFTVTPQAVQGATVALVATVLTGTGEGGDGVGPAATAPAGDAVDAAAAGAPLPGPGAGGSGGNPDRGSGGDGGSDGAGETRLREREKNSKGQAGDNSVEGTGGPAPGTTQPAAATPAAWLNFVSGVDETPGQSPGDVPVPGGKGADGSGMTPARDDPENAGTGADNLPGPPPAWEGAAPRTSGQPTCRHVGGADGTDAVFAAFGRDTIDPTSGLVAPGHWAAAVAVLLGSWNGSPVRDSGRRDENEASRRPGHGRRADSALVC